MGLALVEPSYFLVPHFKQKKSKAGTVGAVAIDRCGNYAAGTSTGGVSRHSWNLQSVKLLLWLFVRERPENRRDRWSSQVYWHNVRQHDSGCSRSRGIDKNRL
ncbi:MAG: isoaspartyl peptidase/L-asparaginase [Pseudomonadota bacterium]